MILLNKKRLTLSFTISICLSFGNQYALADPIETVHDKLEKYATDNLSRSELSPDDLKAAYEEYKSWDPAKREEFELKKVTHALLTDFLLHPMERTHEIRQSKNDIELPIDENYVKRLEKYYKMFRVAYMGQKIGKVYHKCRKTDLLVSSLMGLKGRQDLTAKMIYDAIVEYNAIMQRLSDIMIYEDIYGNLDELKQLLNFNNREAVKILKQVVYPQLKKLKSRKALDRVKETFRDKMADHRIIEQGGVLKTVSVENAKRWRQKVLNKP